MAGLESILEKIGMNLRTLEQKTINSHSFSYVNVTEVQVLEFFKIQIKRKPQKNSTQILLILRSYIKETAQRKRSSSELTQELSLLGCFYKMGTK